MSPPNTSAQGNRQPLTRGQRRLAVGLILSVSLVAFETTAVITALPTITDELHGDSLYGATLSVYMLADLVALVWAGERADRVGVRRPFLICIAVFLAGLVISASAPTMPIVVLGRLLQGAGTGGFAPLSYVAVRRAFPNSQQARLYAFLSAGWVLPSLFAPAISGVVTERFGWRWIFIAIIPAAIAVALLTARSMHNLQPTGVPAQRQPTRLGRALQTAIGVGILTVGLQSDQVLVGTSASVAGIALALPALRTMLPPGTFTARPGLPAIIVVRFMATAAFLGVDSFVPLAADRIHHASAIIQGFVIAGASVSWTIGQAVAAKWPQQFPIKRATTIGFSLLLVGVAIVAPVLSSQTSLVFTFAGWAIGGLGMGLVFNPTTTASMSYANEGQEGGVSSQIHLADSLGFGLMGTFGGTTVAIAERTSFTLPGALGVNFATAAGCAVVGLCAGRAAHERR